MSIEHTRNKFHSLLSILGTNFIAAEHLQNILDRWLSQRGNDFSAHTQPTRFCLKVEYLGRIEYDFQTSRSTGPWIRFPQKQ
jgi:hypothetical protein